jgi:hypothetical protein
LINKSVNYSLDPNFEPLEPPVRGANLRRSLNEKERSYGPQNGASYG